MPASMALNQGMPPIFTTTAICGTFAWASAVPAKPGSRPAVAVPAASVRAVRLVSVIFCPPLDHSRTVTASLARGDRRLLAGPLEARTSSEQARRTSKWGAASSSSRAIRQRQAAAPSASTGWRTAVIGGETICIHS